MKFVNDAIKSTKSVRAIFKALSIVFGLIALSPILLPIAGRFVSSDFQSFSNSYLSNMSYMLTQVFATAFTFVALDYLLKPRVKDLKEIATFESKTEALSALIGAYTRNLKSSSVFLVVVGAGFIANALWNLALAIHWTSLDILSTAGGPQDIVYFLLAFQPFLVALVLILLALFLLGQAKTLRSGLAKLETPEIDLN